MVRAVCILIIKFVLLPAVMATSGTLTVTSPVTTPGSGVPLPCIVIVKFTSEMLYA